MFFVYLIGSRSTVSKDDLEFCSLWIHDGVGNIDLRIMLFRSTSNTYWQFGMTTFSAQLIVDFCRHCVLNGVLSKQEIASSGPCEFYPPPWPLRFCI